MKVEKVEQAASRLSWIKSSHSSEEGGQCVEVAVSADAVHVRDSKDKAGPVLRLDPAEWAAFVRFAAERGA